MLKLDTGIEYFIRCLHSASFVVICDSSVPLSAPAVEIADAYVLGCQDISALAFHFEKPEVCDFL